jgi:RIO kinase 1
MSSDFVLNTDLTFDWLTTDDLVDGQRQSTYADAEKLCKGPDPVPGWVVTERAAIDSYLGILKTGKEADCFLMERAVPGGRASVLASKQYRGEEHRLFHRDPDYTDGRQTKKSRDARALRKKTAWGRTVAAGQWAWAEWEALKRFWLAGVPVPYPVQIQGTELLMEFIEYDGEAAPRLAQSRPSPELLASYFEQLRDAMLKLARQGVAHGDLSPYNVLAAGERLVIIDLPQVVDLVANPAGIDFLMRDCHNVCTWFTRRGLDVDKDALFADLLTQVY